MPAETSPYGEDKGRLRGRTPPPPQPEAELLEFLGSWETTTGEWPESPAAAPPPGTAAAQTPGPANTTPAAQGKEEASRE